jgi:hypothetical protein
MSQLYRPNPDDPILTEIGVRKPAPRPIPHEPLTSGKRPLPDDPLLSSEPYRPEVKPMYVGSGVLLIIIIVLLLVWIL